MPSTCLTTIPGENTPPAPPPKPTNHSTSLHDTPSVDKPHTTPTLHTGLVGVDVQQNQRTQRELQITSAPSIEEAWLPGILKEKYKTDLETAYETPSLLSAVVNAPTTSHPSLTASTKLLQSILATNMSLASHVLTSSGDLARQRTDITAKLLSLRALERQWHLKQSAMDDTLSPFSPKAVHSRLVAGIQEQGSLLNAMEESFLEDEGIASEREITDFLRRWKDARKVLGLREERRARFDEGRVGGWR